LLAGFMAGWPDKVESAVFIAPAGLMEVSNLDETSRDVLAGKYDQEGDGERVRDWVFNFLEGGELVVPCDWEERVGRGDVVAPAVRDWEYKNHDGYQGSVIGIVRDGKVFDNHEAFKRAASTGKRCLFVLGEKDDVAKSEDCEAVGMENVRVIKAASHELVRTRVEDVSGLVQEFWKDIGLM
jgi:hypothetical protein